MKKTLIFIGITATIGLNVSAVVACNKTKKSTSQTSPANYDALKLLIANAKKIKLKSKTFEAFNELKEAIKTAESLSQSLKSEDQKKIDDTLSTLENAIQTFNNSGRRLASNAELLRLVKLGQEMTSRDDVQHSPEDKEALRREIHRAERVSFFRDLKKQTNIDQATAFLQHALNAFQGVATQKRDLKAFQHYLEQVFYAKEEYWNINDLIQAINEQCIDVIGGITISEMGIDASLNPEQLNVKKFKFTALNKSSFSGEVELYQVLNKANQNKTIYIEEVTNKIKSATISAPDRTTKILNIGWDIKFKADTMPIGVQNVPNYISPLITNLDGLFGRSHIDEFTTFNQNLSNWNTSNITHMNYVFHNAAKFNGDISTWDTSKVTAMSFMFSNALEFNGDITNWNTSNVTNMSSMFWEARAFNQDLSAWNTANVENMSTMFAGTRAFNGDISDWDTSKVGNMYSMFYGSYLFNVDISNWKTTNVKNMSYMFYRARAFNQKLSSWDTSQTTDMRRMFAESWVFNQDLSTWDTAKVTNMNEMFSESRAFNQDISKWNVEAVLDFRDFASESKLIPTHQPPKFR
ncbi:BspA family leucine-rich repeat surface protein [Williamsoniiplasma lucivorax]|uniref:Lipoprotein n=1 Tax=Williamsoniiplasma lucivorax TaxID=209274 RepID=A0A2S5R9Y4_9MOLU|nr:BspA family leucine-rich repeat surface protein [Williamsoniiplasma lucivorax]PPE04118.1 hypothetical protein ELUCI_v1c08980 [Williamsoniiplasma lucivorax]